MEKVWRKVDLIQGKDPIIKNRLNEKYDIVSQSIGDDNGNFWKTRSSKTASK